MPNNVFSVGATVTVWPFLKPKELIKAKRGDFELMLTATIKGNLCIEINSGGSKFKFETQRLTFPEFGICKIEIKIDVDTYLVSIFINQKLVLSEIEDMGQAFVAEVEPYIPQLLTYPNLLLVKAKTEDERFFLRTLADLISRRNSEDLYEVVKIAGLLRLLLLDNPCLIDLANKSYKIKLVYSPLDNRLIDRSEDTIQQVIAQFNTLYVPKGQEKYAPNKARNSFVKVPCGELRGQVITIEDVILFCANKYGGVHYEPGVPNKPGQAVFKEIDTVLSSGELPSYCNVLNAVSFLTLQGIKPLVDAIIAQSVV